MTQRVAEHTHARRIWPARLFASLFHFDDLNYGELKQGHLNAIVTSGIALIHGAFYYLHESDG